MKVDVRQDRYLRELGQLQRRFPDEGVLIGSYECIVDGDDEVVFGLLLGLVGQSAPVCADYLWNYVSEFLRDRRRLELFGSPAELRSVQAGHYWRYTPPSGRPVIRQ